MPIAPTALTTPTPATAPSSPATPSPAALPTEQPALAGALTGLRTQRDGSHEITVALHPADLGTVRVHARLHDGTLDVTVACADDSARQAVLAALPALHSELAALSNVAVQLTPSGGSGPQPQRHPDSAPDNTSDQSNQSGPRQDGATDDRQSPRQHRPARDGLDRWM